MKKRVAVILVAIVGLVVGIAFWWHIRNHGVDPAKLLSRTNLAGTSVSYSWDDCLNDIASESLKTGYRISAVFNGDGNATLKRTHYTQDAQSVSVKIPAERYRELIRSLASNEFSRIGLPRRETANSAGGVYKVVLSDGLRRSTVCRDGEHYTTEQFDNVLKAICSFQKEFDHPLNYPPRFNDPMPPEPLPAGVSSQPNNGQP